MGHSKTKSRISCGLLVCAFLAAPTALWAAGKGPPPGVTHALKSAKPSVRYTDYDEYLRASDAYWSQVARKRHARVRIVRAGVIFTSSDYVMEQPPVYIGPPPPHGKRPPRTPVPVVADFLRSARQYFHFVPDRPRTEHEYKRAYAKRAIAEGLTRDQVVRIYGFESGGTGHYDVQAGLEYSHSARAISTALGYNQLLVADTIELLVEYGDRFVAQLREKAAHSRGARRRSLEHKIDVLTRMIAMSRNVPDSWDEHVHLGYSEKGRSVQALILDIDVGPMLQTRRLKSYIEYARARGYTAPLSAAEVEMMNLSGSGNGLDMIIMSPALRLVVPTANFFSQAGYEGNPIVRRNEVVNALLTATDHVMDRESKLRGARDLASFFRH